MTYPNDQLHKDHLIGMSDALGKIVVGLQLERDRLREEKRELVEMLTSAADAIDDARSYCFDDARKISEKVRSLLAQVNAKEK